MPGYAPISPVVGMGPTTDLMVPDTTQKFAGGMVLDAVDPYFGFGRFIYLQAGAAYNPGDLVTIVDQTFLTAVLATTGNLGTPFYVVRQVMSAVNVWGWFQFEGIAPVRVDTGVAAGAAIGIGTTAGRATTNAAGKQLLSVRVLQPATFTLVRANCTTYNGQNFIDVPTTDGLFKGLAVSGTGVAAGTVATLDPGGTRITVSANSTASGNVSVTFTWTGYNMLALQNPFTQGAIT
jgi:hypothetical protein